MYKLISGMARLFGEPHRRAWAAVAIDLAGKWAYAPPSPWLERRVMGIDFLSPIGLAAGFDKQGRHVPALPGLGFGFAEIGSVTPLPEIGRSPGLRAVILRLARHGAPHPIPIGVSISMNRTTSPERMAEDYLHGLAGVRHVADYVTLNLGPRAGPDLHAREHRNTLRSVLHAVRQEQKRLAAGAYQKGRHLPILIKVDQSRGDTDALIACIGEFGFDGLVLSGPIAALERAVRMTDGQMPIVSVGGIRTPQDARDRLGAGAALLQLYGGLVESGPMLIRRINETLAPDNQ